MRNAEHASYKHGWSLAVLGSGLWRVGAFAEAEERFAEAKRPSSCAGGSSTVSSGTSMVG